MQETIFLISLKVIVSIIFFAMSIVFIYACTKAELIKSELANLEKLITEDLAKIYQTGSMASKFIIELVLARYSLDLRKFF